MIRFRHLFMVTLLGLIAVTFSYSSERQALAANSGPVGQVDLVSLQAPGEIGFLTAPSADSPLTIVADLLANQVADLKLTTADVSAAGYVVSDLYASGHNGVTHVYLQQAHQGIRVYNAYINANVMPDGRVLNMYSRFVPNLAAAINTTEPALTPEQAITTAAASLGLTLDESLSQLEANAAEQRYLYGKAGISLEDIPVKLMFQPISAGDVRLAWDVEIYELSGANYWSIRFDALTGAMLSRHNYVVHDQWAQASPDARTAGGQGFASEAIAGLDNSYNVFPLGVESPNHGALSTEVEPWDLTASPFGWHDIDGAAGAEFTTTRGNNVLADTDLDANNIPDGNAPDGGPSLQFDFPFDDNNDPGTYRDFAITNLFYWNNIVHDVMYQYGFDEPAGNFQENNYGNGGAGSDSVNADAQDGSGVNNANFGTPPDGANPRMQMFIWRYPFSQLVTVNSGPLSGDYLAKPANNGGTANGLTADVELVIDTTAPTGDGCESITNDLTGKIALIDWVRGACNSSVFTANALAAGASAVIIIDDNESLSTTFGGSAGIPSVSIPFSDGQAFLTELMSNSINATIDDNPGALADRDSDIDNGIIAHEYGHGISNRLTGGPSAVGCLGNQEQMGEGWSDWMGLFLTTDSSNTGPEPRGVGTYVIFEPTSGDGIRPTPYSTDTGINPSTYGNIDDGGAITIPHGLGYIWNTMLWDMHWLLVDEYGFNDDYYAAWDTGGNNLAHQLIMDGMKLQPCQPGFVTGRDGILAADLALTGGANQCTIWEAFAARGVGVSAEQGSSLVVGDESEAFDIPVNCDPSALNIFLPIINRP